MTSSLVSICIPCRNADAYLASALDSILAQTWPQIEVIVVNDGSTDHTAEVLEAYCDRKVTVVHESCGSAAKARNRALREASGEFIKFFDADDLLSPDFIERQMACLQGSNDAIVSAAWGRFYGDDVVTFQLDTRTQRVWRDMPALDWLVESWNDAQPMMQPGLFLIPRPILEKAGEWDESLTLIDDFEFFARVLCHAREVRFAEGATLMYRSGLPNSLSGQRSRAAVESAFHSLLKGTGHLLSLRNDTTARRSCANVLQDFVYTYFPSHLDLCEAMERRAEELGGSDLEPSGGPGFQKLKSFLGWRAARRIHLFLNSLRRSR